jgi:hypothetical protein
MDPLAERDPDALGGLIAGVPRRAQMAARDQNEPDELRAILGAPARVEQRP